MKTYEVYPVSPNGPQWESLPKAELSNVQWIDVRGIRAWGQLCYDEKFLYIRLEAEEEHILARYTGENDPVSDDSCLEFFFSPEEEGNRYFNVEINPNGACYFGYGCLRHERCRLLCKNIRELFSVRAFSTEKGWGAELALPVWYLEIYFPGFALFPGKKLRGNFQKCAKESLTPHYITWNKIETEKPDFHQPAFFGHLIFK